MYLIHEATIRNPDGVFDVSVIVVSDTNHRKSYTYHLNSEYLVRKFTRLLANKKRHGQAIDLLNKTKIH